VKLSEKVGIVLMVTSFHMLMAAPKSELTFLTSFIFLGIGMLSFMYTGTK